MIGCRLLSFSAVASILCRWTGQARGPENRRDYGNSPVWRRMWAEAACSCAPNLSDVSRECAAAVYQRAGLPLKGIERFFPISVPTILSRIGEPQLLGAYHQYDAGVSRGKLSNRGFMAGSHDPYPMQSPRLPHRCL